jgi:hypothetical protein
VALLLFDRSKGKDGKKNDAIRGCQIAVADADGSHLRRLGLPPAGRLELLDWRPAS